MARSIRIEYPGAFYHVMARGNRRERIFRDAEDRLFFLRTLGEACGRTGWRIHAWVLMGNHYHLVIETPEPNLVSGMQWLQNTYTRRFNVRHRLWGRLFGDRYKSVPVEGSGYYYETLLDYVHLNPVRARLVDVNRGQSVLDFPWSSVAGGHVLPAGRRPAWLASADVLGAFSCTDTAKGRRSWVARLDKRAQAEKAGECGVAAMPEGFDRRCSDLRKGWYWGSQAFGEKLLQFGKASLEKARHRGARSSKEKRAHDEREAERILAEGLSATGMRAEDLRKSPGSDPRKVAIARAVWEQTTVGMDWLAERLSMRSAANVSQQIRRQRQAEQTGSAPRRRYERSIGSDLS
jgi:REP element-mobilizing transposase RayT